MTWDAFAGGTTNDYINLLVGDSAGNVLFQTPPPWEAAALDGSATSVVIPGGTLGASQTCQAQLSFFRVAARDAATYPGATGAVAFASINNRFSLATTAPQLRFGLSSPCPRWLSPTTFWSA